MKFKAKALKYKIYFERYSIHINLQGLKKKNEINGCKVLWRFLKINSRFYINSTVIAFIIHAQRSDILRLET